MANLLIYLAGILWTIETIPQIIKLVRTKQTEGISLCFFIMCLIAYVCFIIGNLMLKNISVVIAHTFPFINLSIISILIIKYRKETKNV